MILRRVISMIEIDESTVFVSLFLTENQILLLDTSIVVCKPFCFVFYDESPSVTGKFYISCVSQNYIQTYSLRL